MRDKVSILDSTLRDGAQGSGIAFSVEDKLAALRLLDRLGVGYIEAGNPGSNPKDQEFFRRAAAIPLGNARLTAFGSTRRKGLRPEGDASLQALLEAGTPCCTIFGKAWKFHVDWVLETTPQENFAMIEESCRFLKSHGREVIFDAEHFFDGWKDDPAFALAALEAAAPNPVGLNGVYQQGDDTGINAIGRKLCALGHGAGNNGSGGSAEY